MIVGLTGGVASGKSLVSKELKRLGAHIIDADVIAREVVRPGEDAYNEIVREFGPSVLNGDGTIDRKKLGSIVFSDEEKRKRLNAITHPRIRQRIHDEIDGVEKKDRGALIVLDIALLIEGGLYNNYRKLDSVIVVYADEAAQIERLKGRDSLTEEEARKRVAAQMPLKEKLKYADYTINNNGTVEETIGQTRELFRLLKTRKKA